MEDTLGATIENGTQVANTVLILVLMEDTLGVPEQILTHMLVTKS